MLEEAVNRVEGITELRSVSAPGQSMVMVTFDLNRDIDAAAQDVRDRVARSSASCRDDIEPPIIQKQDSEQTPTLSVALSGNLSIRELTEIADKTVKVAPRALHRRRRSADRRRPRARDEHLGRSRSARRLSLPIAEVRERAAAAERRRARRQRHHQPLTSARCGPWGASPKPTQFNDLVVATRNGAADPRARHRPRRGRHQGTAVAGARLNGVPTVVLDVRRQSGANTVEVIEAAKATSSASARSCLPACRCRSSAISPTHIYASLHEINVHLILGSILACLVVFAFMRDWRATIIAAVAIPTSVVSTFGLMAALDFTLNTVTMLALVLMVGIVIDDAIVVLENIFRFIEEKGMNAVRGRARGHRRNRAAGAGDDASAWW